MKPIHNYESSSPTNIVDLSTALPCLKDSAAWKKRAEDVRENEWALYQKSLAVLHQALDRMLARPFDPITIRELCDLIEVAFALGRRTVGLPAQGSDKSEPNDDAAFMREVDHMLNKIYGPKTTASPSPERSDLVGRDAAPPAPASNTAPPPGDPTTNNVVTDVAPKPHEPATVPPQTEGGPVAPKSNEDRTEVPHSPKHKPYWLNGHYYSNPEYPESVARAMFANSQP